MKVDEQLKLSLVSLTCLNEKLWVVAFVGMEAQPLLKHSQNQATVRNRFLHGFWTALIGHVALEHEAVVLYHVGA